MTEPAFREGKASFKISQRAEPCETYYKIYGDLDCGQPPLIVLHGGPGSGHDYVEPYSEIWSLSGIPVVLYDQIGCGRSTHLPETVNDHSFWQPSLFVAELTNLIQYLHVDDSNRPGFYVLGHSWGGSLAIAFAATRPKQLRKLIIASSNSTSQHLKRTLWRLKKTLGTEHDQAIDKAVQEDDFTKPEYKAAMLALMSTYLCRGRPFPPPELAKDFANQAADATVRTSMQGRSGFLYNGSLEHWTTIPLLPKINVPTLVFNGEFDTAVYESVLPFFENIPRVRWITLPGASHMPHLDSLEMRAKVMRLVGQFLKPEP